MSVSSFPPSRLPARLSVLAAAILFAGAAYAEAAGLAFDLPAEPLAKSLNQVARQAGVQVVFASPLAEGRQAPALKGNFTARQALERLLAGSGLVLRASDERSFIVEPASAAPGEVTLAPVRVSAAGAAPAFRTATVRSATKTDTAPLDVAQTVNVVEQELIREQRVIRMEDALRNVTGVYAGGGEGRRDQFSIRGFSAELDTYVDGVRDTAGYRDFSNIDRVEVLKGPAAMLFGRGSAGGIINRVTKKPTADNVREVQLTAGSFDFYRAEWDLGGALAEGANIRLTGAHEEGGVFRDDIEHRLSTLAGGVDFQLAPATSLLAQFEWQHHERTPDRGIPAVNGKPADVPVENFYGESFDFSRRDSLNAGLTLNHAFSADTSLKASLRANTMELDATNTRNIGLANGNTQVRRQTLHFPKSKDYVYAQAELSHKLSLAGSEHLLLAGYEHGWQKGRLEVWRTTAPNVSLADPEFVAADPVFTDANKTYDTRFKARSDALFVQDQITFSPQWKAIAGLRYDVFEQRQEAGLVNGAQAPAMERTDRAWSPRAGLIFQPTPINSFYVSAARSFQPEASDLLWAAAANADRKPTLSTQYEVGNKNEFFERKLAVNLALYRIEMSNVATSDPANPGQVIQVGEEVHEGVELDLAGELAGGWRLYGGAMAMNPRITKTNDASAPVGNRPANVPQHAANLWLSKSLGEQWRAGLGVYYVGERYAFADNLVTLPAYTRLDAALSYKLKAMEFSLNLRNLTDKRYYESATNNNQIAPGAPRSAMLTARLAF